MQLNNKVTELEDEKGNLQLKLMDLEEARVTISKYFIFVACFLLLFLFLFHDFVSLKSLLILLETLI